MNEVDINACYRQFQKIKLWNDIGNQIVYFGMQYANPNLNDLVDMNCGGIPEGDFEQVVDISAPMQFISMYTQIAQKRLTFTVQTLVSLNSDFLIPIKDFFMRVGRDLKITGIDSLEKASEIMKDFIFDVGQKGQSNLESNLEQDSANKQGDRPLLLQLESYFLNGLFEASNIKVEITDGDTFTVQWQD